MTPETWFPILKRMCHKICFRRDVDDILQDCALYILRSPPPYGITPQWLWIVAQHRFWEIKRKEKSRGDAMPTTYLDAFGDEGPPATSPPPQEAQVYLKETLKVVCKELGEKATRFLDLCQTGEAGKGAPAGFTALTATERGQLFRARNKIKYAMEGEGKT